MADGEVRVQITADSSKFDDALKRAKRSADKFDNTSSKAARNGVKKFASAQNKASDASKRFTGALDRAAQSAAFVTGPLGGVASRLSLVSSAFKGGHGIILLWSAAIGIATVAMSKAIAEAEKFETSGLKVAAVLKATGNASGLTAEQIRNLSSEIALATLASVEGVEAAATKLLTFRTVQGETFEQALRLSQDLAEVGFGSVETAAVQLGKALEDPEQGLAALRRVGVSFSAQQKQVIKDLVDAGKTAEAQKIILAALEQQVGGAGGAAAGGLSGAYDTLGQRVSEFQQLLATQTGALTTWTNLVNAAATAVNNWNAALFNTPREQIQVLLNERARLQQDLQESFVFRDVRFLTDDRIKARIAAINDEIRVIQDRRVEEQKGQIAAQESAAAAAKAAEEDRKSAEAIEKLNKEKKRLEKARESTNRSLMEEIAVLQAVKAGYDSGAISLQNIAQAQAKFSALASTGLDINSAEGRVLAELIDKRDALAKSIDRETQSRQMNLDVQMQFQAMRDQVKITEMLTAVVGGTKEEMRAATAAAEAYRFEQELLNQIIRQNGSVTEEQRANIRAAAQEFEQLALGAEKAKDAQRGAEFKQEMDIDSSQRIQDIMLEIESTKMLTAAIGGTREEVRNANVELEKNSLRHQLITQVMREQGFVTQEQKDNIEASVDAYGRMVDQLMRVQEAQDQAREKQEEWTSRVEQAQNTIADGFTDMVTGSKTVKEAMKDMILQISQLIVRAQILKAVQAATGLGGSQGFGNPTSFGEAFASVFQFHEGGEVGSGGSRRNVPVSNFISAPRFHDGLAPDEFPAILQRGEQVLSRDEVREERQSRGGRGDVIINVQAKDADSFRQSRRQLAREVKSRGI